MPARVAAAMKGQDLPVALHALKEVQEAQELVKAAEQGVKAAQLEERAGQFRQLLNPEGVPKPVARGTTLSSGDLKATPRTDTDTNREIFSAKRGKDVAQP